MQYDDVLCRGRRRIRVFQGNKWNWIHFGCIFVWPKSTACLKEIKNFAVEFCRYYCPITVSLNEELNYY